ncbi:LysM domain-containing protein [Cordyceps fumosorosea ARSEF 2679]|uniref:LysM domain-containing protein n=1 Tax=Cordyceps fumosorosea (strain ARSEF 2679) TaxID=1081104 RepID=A0A162LQS2_CORFA|nr:LysM domain-containing protein [Cordyceps fumosorosea ARSEF 2679]OAA74234.1 LysM domain-containing protein [Cordyceps fumosorosea ARSEF 2679]
MLGISSQCLAALNSTLPCDNALFQWTLNVDRLHWEEPDVAGLCTKDCTAGAARWRTDVKAACADQYVRSGDRYVPADTLSGRFTDGLNVACAQSSKDQWCLLASYDWVGSDVVQVDCDANPADPWCLNKAEPLANHSRISTLYDEELLCSECFVKMLRLRVNSDFLPDADFSDYLTDELQDVERVCGSKAEPLTTRALPWYPELTDGPLIGITTTPTTTTTARPTATVCAGRTVDIGPDLEQEMSCHDIAEKYEVGSGAVAMATRSEFCYTDKPICIPQKCTLYTVEDGQTCESVASSLSKLNNANVTVAQLATWNPNLLGACDALVAQFICTSPPGGAWTKPPASEIPDNGDGPVRGGPGTTPSQPITDNPHDVAPDKVQQGIATDCTRWILANSTAASCWKLANDARISIVRLCALNPVLGDHGQNCGTQIWLGYYYCVARKGDTPTPTSSSSSSSSSSPPPTSTGPPKPSKTQKGIAEDCVKFEEARSGDSCWAIANRAGVELASLYKWNAVLGAAGENCGTQIWPGYFYCVGVSGGGSPTPTTTSSGPPLPTQTHDGFPMDCKRYVAAKSGDSCWALANDNGVALDVFYKLNPVLGANGENCGSKIWPGYYYCLAR